MSPADERYNAVQMASMCNVKVETMYDPRWRRSTGINGVLFKQGKYLFSWKREFDRWWSSERVACV
jgi:hypothetical protein